MNKTAYPTSKKISGATTGIVSSAGVTTFNESTQAVTKTGFAPKRLSMDDHIQRGG
jgi:hypothetical protein